MIAIDPKRFLGDLADQELARVKSSLFDAMRRDGVRMPGARRYCNHARSAAESIQVPKAQVNDLNALL